MSLKGFFKGAVKGLSSSARVDTVYGEPIRTSGRTIIPVAKVAYGFGGGNETERKGSFTRRDIEIEEGGGGGVAVKPMGIIEVANNRTRYIPFGRKARYLGAILAGFLTGMALGRRQALR